ncbi:hypothetical protein BGZ83_011163 [Gryganskiella cystojenkinii]|nr:hypothetical protein BGZ83_011163 [Gryganskiella cystojenkinii]
MPKEFEAFTGPKWHSSRWRHAIDLTDKRVGIVGSSASAVQIVPKIVHTVKSLQVYGRSPPHITPQANASYSALWKKLFRHVPLFHRLYIAFWYYLFDTTYLIYCETTWYSFLHRFILSAFIRWNLYRQIRDPKLLQKLTPTRSLGAKRTVISVDYYAALQKDHVDYHRSHIAKIDGTKVTLEDGSKQELDILILATGFDALFNFPVGFWTGRGGIDMTTNWSRAARTYFGSCTPNAPNFYMGWGPNSGSLHQPITTVIEAQVMVMIKSLSTMMENNYAAMEIKEEATREFMDIVTQRNGRQVRCVLNHSSLSIPQKNDSVAPGLYTSGFWTGSLTEFRWRVSKVHPGLFSHTLREKRASSLKEI